MRSSYPESLCQSCIQNKMLNCPKKNCPPIERKIKDMSKKLTFTLHIYHGILEKNWFSAAKPQLTAHFPQGVRFHIQSPVL